MRLIFAIFALTLAAHAQGSAALAAHAYYLSTTGNDANAGTAASPWLTPNHAVNGKDILWASAGTYAQTSFEQGNWGTVGTCCAIVRCATFDGCKISVTGTNFGFYVDKSNWEVDGWECTTTSSGFTCFAAAPNSGAPTNIHHIIFANNVCNGAGGGCFSAYNQTTHSVDYVAFVGNIAYNGAQNSTNCYSGLTIFQPLASDSVAGTHLYIGGNFAWGNIDPNPCAGHATNGGNGYISDTKDGSQGLGVQYAPQEYVENNIFLGNGTAGLAQQGYTSNPAVSSPTYWRHNTVWGNLTDPNYNSNSCFEAYVNKTYTINADHNIFQSAVSTSCTGHSTYGAWAYDSCGPNSSNCVNSTAPQLISTIANNWIFSAAGTGFASGSFNDEGNTPPNTFTFGTNSAGSPPVSAAFTAPAVPGAPSCGAASSVPNCMSTVIANFVPTAGGTSGFGYQSPTNTNGSDVQFPKWICGIVPSGLVTPSC